MQDPKYNEINVNDLEKVCAFQLFKKDGSPSGVKYVAFFKDGSEVVVRAKATRLYEKAFLYNLWVASGKSGLAGHFSFGKSPASYYAKNVVKVFPVVKVA